MSTAQDKFSELTGDLDYPMLVVTVIAGGEGAGCLVGFATQCSIDPPRFIVCLSDKNRTTRVAAGADALAVHFLPATAIDLAELFGSETGDDVDKLARCDWHGGPEGLPILDACGRWFAGRIISRHSVGDHIAHVLAPFAVSADGSTEVFRLTRPSSSIPATRPNGSVGCRA